MFTKVELLKLRETVTARLPFVKSSGGMSWQLGTDSHTCAEQSEDVIILTLVEQLIAQESKLPIGTITSDQGYPYIFCNYLEGPGLDEPKHCGFLSWDQGRFVLDRSLVEDLSQGEEFQFLEVVASPIKTAKYLLSDKGRFRRFLKWMKLENGNKEE